MRKQCPPGLLFPSPRRPGYEAIVTITNFLQAGLMSQNRQMCLERLRTVDWRQSNPCWLLVSATVSTFRMTFIGDLYTMGGRSYQQSPLFSKFFPQPSNQWLVLSKHWPSWMGQRFVKAMLTKSSMTCPRHERVVLWVQQVCSWKCLSFYSCSKVLYKMQCCLTLLIVFLFEQVVILWQQKSPTHWAIRQFDTWSEMLLNPSLKHCPKCEAHRRVLPCILTRNEKWGQIDRCSPDSHVNYHFLSTPEKVDWLQRLHTLQRETKQQLVRLKWKLAQAIEQRGLIMDETTHHDLQHIVNENTSSIAEAFPENSFQWLFWEQQQQSLQLKGARSMRWHPLIIKWCLYLRHLSGKAYDTLRSSGYIRLPSQRTLRDYTHYVSVATGFSSAVDQQLMCAADVESVQKDKSMLRSFLTRCMSKKT